MVTRGTTRPSGRRGTPASSVSYSGASSAPMLTRTCVKPRASAARSASAVRAIIVRRYGPWWYSPVSSATARSPRPRRRHRPGLHGEALHRTPISAVRTPGQIAAEPPPARRRAERAAKPATPLGPGRPRPLDHALADGQDAPPRAAPVGEHDRLVDVRAARQHLHVEQHAGFDPLDLDAHAGQPDAERGGGISRATRPRLDADQHAVGQD